jgi:hypothetical protein
MSVRGFLIVVGSTVALLAVGIAGCGGGDDTTEVETTAALSKSEFVTQANQICREGNKETDAAFENFDNETSKAEAETVIEDTFVPSVQRQINEIRDLGAPEGDEAKVDHMLDLAQADLDRIAEEPGIVLNGEDVDQFADFAKIGHPYGLTECDAPE